MPGEHGDERESRSRRDPLRIHASAAWNGWTRHFPHLMNELGVHDKVTTRLIQRKDLCNPEVADLVAERAPATSVLAARGIADGRSLAATLSLAADGVVVGTRLLASWEAPVHAEAQGRLIASTSDDTVRTTVLDIVGARLGRPP